MLVIEILGEFRNKIIVYIYFIRWEVENLFYVFIECELRIEVEVKYEIIFEIMIKL